MCFVFLAKIILKSYIWSIAFDGADTCTLEKIDHKCPESFEMWCWRELEEIKLTNGVKMEKYCVEVKEKWNMVLTVKQRKAKRIGYTLRWNCFLKYIFEGKLEGLGI